jgi:hypothetical protein
VAMETVNNQKRLKYLSRAEFDLQYIKKDYEELAEGFYRIKKVEKKKKKKKNI